MGENGGMKEMSGKQLNLSVYSKRGKVIRMRPYGVDGKPLETAGKLYSAELRSLETDKRVSGVSVSYTKERDVLLGLPAMGVGQYVLVVDVSVESGAAQNFLAGYVTYMEPAALVKPERESVPERLLCVYQDDEGVRCEWWETSAAEIAAERAEEAAEKAEEMREGIEAALDAAVEKATERSESAAVRAEAAANRAADAERGAVEAKNITLEKFSHVDYVVATWNERIASAIVPSGNTGTWIVGGVDTRAPWRGEAGKSPYVGTNGNWMTFNDSTETWTDSGERARAEDGFSPHINSLGLWVYMQGGEIVTGPAAAGKDGIDGTAVRRIMVNSYDDIPQEGDTCNGGFYYYVPLEDGSWNVYAWLETPDGNGGWVFVGLANDIATAEVHGLVKLGTDTPVVNGAPVGNDKNGGMAVPPAQFTVAGSVRPTSELVAADGGYTHMDAAGGIWVDWATTSRGGGIMLSYNGTVDADSACLGLRADGKASVRWATLDAGGICRLGSYLEQVASRPYILSVGAISDPDKPNDKHKLANNLLIGGALKHQMPNDWVGANVDGVSTSDLRDGYYLGLHTSSSFKQTQAKGLELKVAAQNLLGGVYVSTGLPYTGNTNSTVPTCNAVTGWVSNFVSGKLENYYTKSQVYTKAQTEGIIDSECAERVPYYAEQTLRNYALKSEVIGDLADKASASSVSSLAQTVNNNKAATDNTVSALSNEVAALKGQLKQYVQVGNSGMQELSKLSYDEFIALSSLDDKKLYFVLA